MDQSLSLKVGRDRPQDCAGESSGTARTEKKQTSQPQQPSTGACEPAFSGIRPGIEQIMAMLDSPQGAASFRLKVFSRLLGLSGIAALAEHEPFSIEVENGRLQAGQEAVGNVVGPALRHGIRPGIPPTRPRRLKAVVRPECRSSRRTRLNLILPSDEAQVVPRRCMAADICFQTGDLLRGAFGKLRQVTIGQPIPGQRPIPHTNKIKAPLGWRAPSNEPDRLYRSRFRTSPA